MDLQLNGKRVLVTGSSAGIGVAIAQMMAAEGALVVINGRNQERAQAVADAIVASGGKAAIACGDLATDEGATLVADAAVAAFGGIDVLVNNAGGQGKAANPSWFTTAVSDWTYTFESNVLAAVRLIHRFVPPMKERKWGRVINIATGAAITPTSAQPDYGASKAAMLNFSLSLSKALSQSGVTSNCVSPGMIRTEGLLAFLKDFSARRGWGDDIARAEAHVAKGCGQTVNRIGEVEDIAYAVTLLASPRSDFINGANFHIDGGISPSLN